VASYKTLVHKLSICRLSSSLRLTSSQTIDFTIILVSALAPLRTDYYKTLAVDRGASDIQIKRAYRKLALKYHPDKNKGDQKAAGNFAEISNAYEVLSNKEKRRVYDQYGEDGVRQHDTRSGQGRHQHDIFSQFFGNNFGFDNEEADIRHGDDVVLDLELSLEDLYTGCSLKVGRDKGVHKPAKGKRKCRCMQRMVTRQVAPGMFQQYAKEECEECDNIKIVRGFEIITIDIEAGTPDGHEITLYDDGETLVDGGSGELRVRIRSANNTKRKRFGNDLHILYEIDLAEALAGFTHEFIHFDGHIIELQNTEVTMPGQILSIPSEGFPIYDVPNSRGDLVITFQVIFPEILSLSQKVKVKDILKK
jgi:DnaJ homolog subfamily B member 11